MDVKEENILGAQVESHWYYRSKAAALLRYVGSYDHRIIVDVGAGSGFFTKYLLTHTKAYEGICVDPAYPAEWNEVVNGKPVRFIRSCDTVDADLVLLMDVLEHVEDDVSLVADYASKVESGTHFLITVPAFKLLWSGHDVFLEHKRRYTLDSLDKVIRAAGLKVITLSYFFGFVFPIAAALRITQNLFKGIDNGPKSNLKKHNIVTNGILAALCQMELPISRINRLAGLSVFCLAQKK